MRGKSTFAQRRNALVTPAPVEAPAMPANRTTLPTKPKATPGEHLLACIRSGDFEHTTAPFNTTPMEVVAVGDTFWVDLGNVAEVLEYSGKKSLRNFISRIETIKTGEHIITVKGSDFSALGFDIKKVSNLGGRPSVTLISEEGVFLLTQRSHKPNARPVQEFFAKVGPQLRRTGKFEVEGYIPSGPGAVAPSTGAADCPPPQVQYAPYVPSDYEVQRERTDMLGHLLELDKRWGGTCEETHLLLGHKALELALGRKLDPHKAWKPREAQILANGQMMLPI